MLDPAWPPIPGARAGARRSGPRSLQGSGGGRYRSMRAIGERGRPPRSYRTSQAWTLWRETRAAGPPRSPASRPEPPRGRLDSCSMTLSITNTGPPPARNRVRAEDDRFQGSAGATVKDHPDTCQPSGDAGTSSITRNTTAVCAPGHCAPSWTELEKMPAGRWACALAQSMSREGSTRCSPQRR